MKYLVVSDTHGVHWKLKKVVDKVKPDAVIHAGDLSVTKEKLQNIIQCPLIAVKGNCDYGNQDLNEIERIKLGRHNILITHGERYHVGFGLERLLYLGQEQEASCIIFGHTHISLQDYREGIYLLNPGSLSQPRQHGRHFTYATLELDQNGELFLCINEL